ncbi:hypothetical protein FV226_09325 [Methylobacterium sp. WL12]|uniref:hypothetical protein n=1 Tax=Methylobacterium sp. WL12 TaxID=2603890 RepID=UPI0011CC96C4|nr:hypothetical protein [Methylobacterium sp. WL12]TXM73404.1 hypothetical protein FV226_09325 [Methylobacterium sp. WL12]
MIHPRLLVVGLAAGLCTAPPLPAQATERQAIERQARSRLCPEDAPEGVRLPPQPGCGSREVPASRRETGFHEILPGTAIRVGGRASSTFDMRR